MWTKFYKKRFAPTTKHVPKINVWAAFSSMGVFPLCIFRENMNTDKFLQILEGHLLTQAHVFHEDHWRIVMDNDPKHTSKRTKAWVAEHVPNIIPWPAQSPDLNPIENLFGWVKQELLKLAPRTIPELKTKLEAIWNRIERGFLKGYWESMPRRCQMAIDRDGYPIKY